jgi:hypothetical protein
MARNEWSLSDRGYIRTSLWDQLARMSHRVAAASDVLVTGDKLTKRVWGRGGKEGRVVIS